MLKRCECKYSITNEASLLVLRSKTSATTHNIFLICNQFHGDLFIYPYKDSRNINVTTTDKMDITLQNQPQAINCPFCMSLIFDKKELKNLMLLSKYSKNKKQSLYNFFKRVITYVD